MKKITLKLKKNSYPIIIKRGLKENIGSFLKEEELGNFAFVITSPKIYNFYKSTIDKNFNNKHSRIIITANGEKAKSKYWLFRVIQEFLKINPNNKKPFIICLGGGTIGDLGGFIASIYKRGINYVQVPTTLVGQIDSSIGGKTAINLPEAKNIIGTFYQPKKVLIDPDFLNSLSKNNLKEGLSEAIKCGLIKNPELFYLLKNNPKKIINLDRSLIDKIIYACVKIKSEIVAEDEKEKKGIRTILNFGHTFAHALEASSKYKKISHGRAVAIGMLYAAYLSHLMGRTQAATVNEIENALKLFGFPPKINYDKQQLLKSISYDKKFTAGKIRMVLIRKIGSVEISTEISPQNLKKTFKYIDLAN